MTQSSGASCSTRRISRRYIARRSRDSTRRRSRGSRRCPPRHRPRPVARTNTIRRLAPIHDASRRRWCPYCHSQWAADGSKRCEARSTLYAASWVGVLTRYPQRLRRRRRPACARGPKRSLARRPNRRLKRSDPSSSESPSRRPQKPRLPRTLRRPRHPYPLRARSRRGGR